MASEYEEIVGVRLELEDMSVAEREALAAGERVGQAYARGVRSGSTTASTSAIQTPVGGNERRNAATNLVAEVTGSAPTTGGPSTLAVAEKRATAAVIDVALTTEKLDEEERKYLQTVRSAIRVMASEEASVIKLQQERDRQAKALQAQTAKISRQEEIFQAQGTSTEEIRGLQAERQAYTSLASTLSEQRRRLLASPDTTASQRIGLELGGNSLLQAQAGQFTGSPLVNELKKGFFGTRDPGDQLSFGGSIGQVGRFTTLYGGAYALLYQLTNGFQAATKEAIDFTNAIQELNLTSGQTTDTNAALATSLGNIAAAAGVAPSEGVKAGAQAIGIFGVAQAAPDVQASTAIAATQVSTRISALGGGDNQAVLQDLGGLARSLDLQASQLPALEDQLTYVAKQIGRPVSELLPAAAAVGQLGTSAGFTPEELFAAIGRITSTTGQSASAAGGSLRQVLSRADDPNFAAKVQAQFGIDTTGKSLRDIFAEFSARNPNSTELNQFSLLFGRGGSQQVAQILGSQFGKVETLAQGANQASGTGLGQQVFNTITQSIDYQLKQLGAAFLNLGKDLAQTGVLDFLGLLVKGSLEVVKAVDQLVQLFNLLPPQARAAAFGIIEFQLAMKAFAGVRPLFGAGLSGVRGAITGRLGEDAVAAAGQGFASRSLLPGFLTAERSLPTLAGVNAGLVGAANGVGPALLAQRALPGFVTGPLATLGSLPGIRALQGLGATEAGALGAHSAETAGLSAVGAGAVAGAVGVAAIIAVGVIKNLVEVDAVKQQIQDSAIQIASARNSKDLQAGIDAAKEAKTRAAGLTSAGLDLQTLTGQTALNALNVTGAVDVQNQAQAQIDFGNAEKARLDAAQKAATRVSASNGIDFTTVDTLALSIKNLTTQGFTAAERINAVNDAFLHLITAAQSAGTAVQATIQPGQGQVFGITSGIAANDALQQTIGYAGDKFDASKGAFGIGGDNRYKSAIDALQSQVDPTQLSNLVTSALTSQVAQLPKGKNGETNISPEQAKALEASALTVADSILPKNLPDDVRKVFDTSVTAAIRNEITKLGGGGGTQGLGANVSDTLSTVFSQYAEDVATQTITLGSSAKGGRASLTQIDRTIALTKEALKSLSGGDRVDAARVISNYETQRQGLLQQVVASEVAEAQTFASLAQSKLTSDNNIGRDAIAVTTATNALKAAKTTGNIDTIAQAQTALNNALTTQAKDLLDAANAARLANVDPRNNQAALGAQLANAQATLGTLTPGTAQYEQTLQTIKQLKQQITAGAIAISNAAASAGVAGDSSQIDQARVAVGNARRSLAASLPGTAEYYQNLAALRTAQKNLADAELAYASDLRKLNSDLTDPVAQARNAVKDAQAKLAADRKSGQGKDVIAADQVGLKNAQNQAEAAAFNQRLSDAQINDQLGRTSHQAYLNYLNNEHDRLSSIAHRTRQQQDELNQVDLAIKAANQQLTGQFNLGDIKPPSPYEVRRYISAVTSTATSGALASAATFSGPGGLSAGTVVNNSVLINGADTAMIETIIRQIIAGSAINTATSTGRRA